MGKKSVTLTLFLFLNYGTGFLPLASSLSHTLMNGSKTRDIEKNARSVADDQVNFE